MNPEHLSSLRACVRGAKPAVVAFSGGADSTLLLRIAKEEMGDGALAVMAVSELIPSVDIHRAREIAAGLDVPLETVEFHPLQDDGLRGNGPQRCYHCKRAMLQAILDLAGKRGLGTVMDGTNADDLGEPRPGNLAVQELGIRSPLAEVGVTSDEVRSSLEGMGMVPPDGNTCLATRIPFHRELREEELRQVEEAEEALRAMGLSSLRVRHHGPIARVEVPIRDMRVVLDRREEVVGLLRAAGFDYVALDLEGLGSGSMERML